MSNQEQKPDESRPQKTNDAIAWIIGYVIVVVVLVGAWKGCQERFESHRRIRQYEQEYYDRK